MSNFLLHTDSYKLTHWKQYPSNAEIVYSYLESRGGDYKETVFFGLEYYLQKYLAGKVFNLDDVEEAAKLSFAHFGSDLFNAVGWMKLYNKYNGALPLEIR